MLEKFKGHLLEYTKLAPEEMQSRGILGRLVGKMCDTNNGTRNNRFYSKALWEKAMEDPIFKEKLENKCILAELEHPTDGRTQIAPVNACACLAEMPKLSDDGFIYGVWDILNTPNGQIVKTLCDYGTKIGISSRGEGDVIEGYDGDEVDPDTYALETWDLVLLPAVKDARMQLVTESVENTKTLKAALDEAIENADEASKVQMQETVNRLFDKPVLEHVELVEDTDPVSDETENHDEVHTAISAEDEKEMTESKECNNQDDCADKSVEDEKEPEEVADGKSVLLSDLQEALRVQKELKAGTKELRNKLAVSDAKVNELTEELNKYKNLTIKLSESAKDSKKKVKDLDETIVSLKESLAKAKAETKADAKKLTESISKKEEEVTTVTEKLQKSVGLNKKLNENLKSLNENVASLTEQLDKANCEISELKESIEDEKQNSLIKVNEYTSKVQKAINIAESYKKAANLTMDHYIESKAKMLGVSKNEIKNRLGKTYTVNDVDTVCESLRSYRLNLSKLPFNVEGAKVKFTESKNDNLRIENLADEIDDQLIEMVKNLH